MNRALARCAIFIIFLLQLTAGLFSASLFSNYDFTFYETVSQSLAIMDSSTIGLDYTGFGFVGEKNTNGLFVRLGFQMPYTTLINIFTDPELPSDTQTDSSGEDESFDLVTGSSDDNLFEQNEYRITFLIGPAVRYVFSPQFDFYLGAGAKIEEHIVSSRNLLTGSRQTVYSTVLAFDCDFGFKFNLERNTSCRTGIYTTFELLSYTYTSSRAADGEHTFSTSDIHLNVIATGDSRISLSALGYISMGMTFSSQMQTQVYRYETAERGIGKGTITLIS